MSNKAQQPGLNEAGRAYEYYAFISYKHLDKPWAKWVQHGLEHYRLPTRLCRSGDVPKHVSPVFRDETDLTGGRTVHDHLLDKIGKSKYLIVICSRNMQKNPQYIDYEVESFLAAGNPAARILPLIVDGEANSKDPAKECLPPSLLKMGDKMPLGVTVNPKNKKEAILKLVASILELELQTLRAHNQERKQKRIVAALSGGLAFSLGLGAFMGWQMLKVTESGLHEQLTYAEDVFRQGDHLSAQVQAQEIKEAYHSLMAEDIRTDAEKLSVMSAITPKYLPMTALCGVTADSHLLFTRDGQQVMVITESTVRKYNMQGEMIMEFATSQTVNHIVDVSVDGVHAVVATVFQPGWDGTHLWLWNMETNQMVAHLVGSEQYTENNKNMGYYLGVVDARMRGATSTLARSWLRGTVLREKSCFPSPAPCWAAVPSPMRSAALPLSARIPSIGPGRATMFTTPLGTRSPRCCPTGQYLRERMRRSKTSAGSAMLTAGQKRKPNRP